MRSIIWEAVEEIDALRPMASRLEGLAYEGPTAAELVVILDQYAILIGRLEAVEYELLSPFTRPSGRRT